MLVTDYLDESARRFPDKPAFVDERRSMSFSELRQEALNIAGALVDRKLFKQPIVIYLEKSVECIAAFMGAAYSGNFYTPLDTSMPLNRINKIIETLKPSAMITDRVHEASAQEFASDIPILLYDELQSTDVDEDKVLRTTARIIDTDVLYVLFTSGSTGMPKGVIIPHQSVVDYTNWFVDTFNISENDRLGNQSPLYFDLSIQDVFAPLKSGATTLLIAKEKFSFPAQLMAYLVEQNINVIVWVPSALCIVAKLHALRVKSLPTLRLVAFCGEVMPNKYLNQWRKVFPLTKFVNMYGPAEACDASTYYEIDREFQDDEPLPIGEPCRNTGILILNEQDELVERGSDELGELCIRGSSLAHGYYNNPDKTAEVFVQNPLNKSYPELIYRTGDLVRYNERGELVYVCRKDFQIKHMGHRIELGEIETAVSSLSDVDANCCLYDATRQRIVLFYTGRAEQSEITTRLSAMVPDYMLPNRFIKLESMPMNLNGKIDRAALKNLLANG